MNKYFLFFLFILGISNTAHATHIVGGEVTYDYKGGELYDIHLSYFLDCKNGSPEAIRSDKSMYMAVFDGGTNSFLSTYSKYIQWSSSEKIEKINYTCYTAVPSACVRKYTYTTKNVRLPARKGGYIISFQRCCRNNTITNLFNAGKTGANYWTTIANSSTQSKNSSAKFKELPPNFLCKGAPLSFDHSATDADGDSLSYSLFHPFLAGSDRKVKPTTDADRPPFSNVIYGSGYSYNNPIDGNPALAINPKTGILLVTPTRIGQFVIGILVHEYRNGVLINTTRRDYQLNVQNCPNVVAANFYTDKVHCKNKIDLSNYSSKANEYTWIFDNGDPDIIQTSKQNIRKFLKPGKHVIKLVAKNSVCSDTFTRYIEIKDSIKFDLGNDTMLCKKAIMTLAPKNLTPNNGTYEWSNFQATKSIKITEPGEYRLTINDGFCNWRDTIQIKYDINDIDLGPDSLFCQEENIDLTFSINGDYDKFKWSTGEVSSSIKATKPGIYSVEYSRPLPLGCTYTDQVEIKQHFIPPFKLTDTTICPGFSVTKNVNVGAFRYEWNDGESNPNRTFMLPGNYFLRAYKDRCFIEDGFDLHNFKTDLDLGDNIIACGEVKKTFTLNPSYTKVLWQDGSTEHIYSTITSGIKKVRITTENGCIEEDSVSIKLFPLPYLNLGNDTTICTASPLSLDAGKHFHYLWYNGWEERFLRINLPGKYKVTVTDEVGCQKSDSIFIKKDAYALPSELFFANSFTPNNDGINDEFPANQFKGLEGNYNFQIINRWGQKVFETNNPYQNWNGSFKDKIVKSGVYVYMVHWTGCDGKYRTMKGNLTVLY